MRSLSNHTLIRASAILVLTPFALIAQTAQTATRQAANAAATVPVEMMPPAGKCRVWVDGVPAARQPAPTDCATALRQKPANGRVIYGPSATPAARSAAPLPTKLAPSPSQKAPPVRRKKPERP